jgi:sialate O-acetylesterase
MIAPLTPFSIRGVIWYQGEANVTQANDYFDMFSAIFRGWRQAWGQPELPFLFVQLAPHHKIVDQPGETAWAMLREAQLRVSQTVPNTGMAVITDWGHETEIHVRQKQPVGERLARVARSMVYHEKDDHAGPVYRNATVDGAEMVIRFETHGNRLVAKRLMLEDVAVDRRTGESGGALHVAADNATTSSEIPVQGFTIAGEDRRFVTAQAKLVDQTVIVSSPAVKHPVPVRYGWADYPTGNLFTNTGLPASPFRTDDWPVAK